jgi:ASC-1-like (ASCH) protein
MKTHELKMYSSYFIKVKEGLKTFEVRKNDRDFKVGDIFRLTEINEMTGLETGRYLSAFKITYILNEFVPALREGYVVFSFIYL